MTEGIDPLVINLSNLDYFSEIYSKCESLIGFEKSHSEHFKRIKGSLAVVFLEKNLIQFKDERRQEVSDENFISRYDLDGCTRPKTMAPLAAQESELCKEINDGVRHRYEDAKGILRLLLREDYLRDDVAQKKVMQKFFCDESNSRYLDFARICVKDLGSQVSKWFEDSIKKEVTVTKIDVRPFVAPSASQAEL